MEASLNGKNKFICDCGSIITKGYMKMHFKTLKHIAFINRPFVKNYEVVKHECYCGKIYNKSNNSNHLKSKYHREYCRKNRKESFSKEDLVIEF